MTDNLSVAASYVANGRRIVANQKALIERLRQVGADTLDAQLTLDVLEASLRIFEEHIEHLEKVNGSSRPLRPI